jgi:hypothetical protein
MTDDEIPTPEPDVEERDATEDTRPQRTGAELRDLVETLLVHVKAHQAYIEVLQQKVAALEAVEEEATSHLPPWLTFSPPPAGEDKGNRGESPLFTIAHFVQYYNETYVGKAGTRAVAIPDCWLDHPGLLAELATLAYTWRDSHLGKKATVRDAQYWHDRWRVGFAERLATEWTHQHCLTDGHKQAGAAPRVDRYTEEHRFNSAVTSEPTCTEPSTADSSASP